MNRRLDRTARNEALIRAVNERIEQVDKAAEEAKLDHKETLFEFRCECGDGDAGDVGCEAHVELSLPIVERMKIAMKGTREQRRSWSATRTGWCLRPCSAARN